MMMHLEEAAMRIGGDHMLRPLAGRRIGGVDHRVAETDHRDDVLIPDELTVISHGHLFAIMSVRSRSLFPATERDQYS
jgi:hypothetical protein